MDNTIYKPAKAEPKEPKAPKAEFEWCTLVGSHVADGRTEYKYYTVDVGRGQPQLVRLKSGQEYKYKKYN